MYTVGFRVRTFYEDIYEDRQIDKQIARQLEKTNYVYRGFIFGFQGQFEETKNNL